MIMMSSEFEQIKTIKILYYTYIRSHLEYVSQVWNPVYDIYINQIERIQKRFLRYLQFRLKKFMSNYSARCRKFHILPHKESRRAADLSYLLDIASSSIDCPELLGQLRLRTPTLSVRSPNLLHIPRVCSIYRQNSYLIRSCRCYNEMAREVDIDLFNTSSTT